MLAPVPERSLDELCEGHRCFYPELAGELGCMSPAEFFAPQAGRWSPAEHVDHLVRSVTPMADALRWPRFALRLLFGAGGASRPTEEIVGVYLERLGGGVVARGRYRPAVDGAEASYARQQQAILRCRLLGDRLCRALFRWRDRELDEYRLPHPVLGKLTVRQMLAWSLYHGRHHHARIRELGRGGVAREQPEPKEAIASGAATVPTSAGRHSGCLAIHFADGEYVALGPEAPDAYRQYDYGTTIGVVWGQVVNLGQRIGAGGLDRFLCPEEEYVRAGELLEELDEAEAAGDDERIGELRAELSALLPAHDPASALVVVRGLVRHLESHPEGDLAELALLDLRAWEIAFERAAAEGRSVFISPL